MTNLQERLFNRAQRYIGIREVPGAADHPLIVWWHSLCYIEETDPDQEIDEIPWCSSFVNGVCWDERAARSKSARARSWLTVGSPVALAEAVRGDIAVIKRGPDLDKEPGPEVVNHRGHVFVLAGASSGVLQGSPDAVIEGVGGNQGNRVSVASFPLKALLSIRRL